MTAVAAPTQGLELGRVIRAGFALIARRPLVIVLLAMFLAYLPALAEVWAASSLAAIRPKPGAPGYWSGWWRNLGLLEVVGLLVVGFNWIFQGGVALCAAPASTGDGGVAGRLPGRSPTLFLTGIVTNVFVLLGTLALLIPGLLMGLAWCAGPAVTATEGVGFLGALHRSADLTRGKRGAILGLLVLYVILRGAVIYGFRFAAGAPKPLEINSGAAYLVFGVQPILSAALSVIYAAVMASVYFELRRLHDGVAMGSVAATFD